MGGYEHLALVGTTAVVALVGTRMIYVANCGDSRAVLCRTGGALPLTDDHKAAREDETVREAGRPVGLRGAERRLRAEGVAAAGARLLLHCKGLQAGRGLFMARACMRLTSLHRATPHPRHTAGARGGGGRADPVLERRARDGPAGGFARHWRPLAAALRHCRARGEGRLG